MNFIITFKASAIAALLASLCVFAGCNRNDSAGGASSYTSAAAPASASSAPVGASFPATAASDTPSGASQ